MNKTEEMARVHWENTFDSGWDDLQPGERQSLISEMRAAVAVLREPSEAMLEAGEATFFSGYTGTPTSTPDRVWQAMIDAADGDAKP